MDYTWMESEAAQFDDCPATFAELQARLDEYHESWTDEAWWRYKVALDSRMQPEAQGLIDIRNTYDGVKRS